MFENHKQMVDALSFFLERDRDVHALIVIGSVARDDAYDEESDLDTYAVVTEEAYAAGKEFDVSHLVVGPSAGIGICPVTLFMLKEYKECGTDFVRYSFKDAKVTFSKIDGLKQLVKNIYQFQTSEKDSKIQSFYSQILFHHSFLEFGEYSGNTFVLHQRAIEIFYYGGRIVIAANNRICPPSKKFLEVLNACPDKPDSVVEHGMVLLSQPSIENSRRYIELIQNHYNCEEPLGGFFVRANSDGERWKKQLPPLYEW